jgi:hypothetical protein
VIVLKPWWPRFISFDWGFDHAAVTYWHATDGENYFTYREWVTSHTTAPDIAAGWVERTPEALEPGGFNERAAVTALYAGPDVFSRKTSDRTVAIELESALAGKGFELRGITAAAAGPGDRRLGWNFMYQLLQQGRWKISPRCAELIKALPAAVRDYPNHAEDAKKTNDVWDDCRDSARYGIYTSAQEAVVPLKEAAAKMVTAPMTNLTARAIEFRNAMADIERGRSGMRFGR